LFEAVGFAYVLQVDAHSRLGAVASASLVLKKFVFWRDLSRLDPGSPMPFLFVIGTVRETKTEE